MELEEFRELALQSIPKVTRGRTVRYTLVRTPGEFFLNKIHREQYLDLKSIPLLKNYRFIQSTLTHGEYTTFREDFFRDFDFLKIRNILFSNLVEEARKLGFELYGFSLSGKGRIDVKSPPGGDSAALVDLLRDNESKGMRPYLMTFRRGRCKVTIRKDFNYFVHGGYWDAMPLIYATARNVVEHDLEMLEKISSLMLRTKGKALQFTPLSPVRLNVKTGDGKEELLKRLSSLMNVREIMRGESIVSVHAFQKGNERSAYRIDLADGEMEFLPTLTSRMEGVIDMLDMMEED